MADVWRKRNRLSGYDYSQPSMYFITVCTCEMRCLLGDRETLAPSEYADIVQEAIENIGRISTIVRLMKRCVTISTGKSIWQRPFHDHVIRNEREYRKIWEYSESNPGKWTEDCYYI